MKNYEGKVNTEAIEIPSARAYEPAIVASSHMPKERKANPVKKEVFRNANAIEDVVNTASSEASSARAYEAAIVASRMPSNRMTNPFEKVVFGNTYANGGVRIEANEAQTARAIVASWIPRNRIGDPFGREVFPTMIANQGPVNNEAPAARAYEPAIVALSQMPNQIMTYPFEKGVFRNMNANGGVVNTEAPAAKTYEPISVASSRITKERRTVSFEKEIPQANMGQRDADEMFLLSQIPYIKKMKTNDKLQFQMQFLQLVHMYSNTDESSATQNPSPANSTFSSTSKLPSIAELDEDSMVSN